MDAGMIALLPEDPAALTVDSKSALPASQIHLTLVYLGDDVTAWQEDRVELLIRDVAMAVQDLGGAIQARVMGHATFNPDGGPEGDRDPCDVYLVGDSGLLTPMHDLIDAVCEARLDVDYPWQHKPWIPHMTVAVRKAVGYEGEDEASESMSSLPGSGRADRGKGNQGAIGMSDLVVDTQQNAARNRTAKRSADIGDSRDRSGEAGAHDQGGRGRSPRVPDAEVRGARSPGGGAGAGSLGDPRGRPETHALSGTQDTVGPARLSRLGSVPSVSPGEYGPVAGAEPIQGESSTDRGSTETAERAGAAAAEDREVFGSQGQGAERTPSTAVSGAHPLSELTYSGPVVFNRIVVAIAGRWAEIALQLPADESIASYARTAYAQGWARSNGPMTDRVKAGCVAAVDLAVTHADQPGILEATMRLGSLEGTWAAVYARREALVAHHTTLVMAAWRRSAHMLNVSAAIDRFRQSMGLGESVDTDNTNHRRLVANSVASTVASTIAGPDAAPSDREAIIDATSAALMDAEAEGYASAVMVGADQLGVSGTDFELVFHDAHAALGDLGNYWGQGSGWVDRMVAGNATDLGGRLSTLAADGADYQEMLDAARDVIGGDDVRAVSTILDLAMGQSFTRGALALYAREGVPQVDFVTAGGTRVCFPAGTPVQVPTGIAPIEALNVGDWVDTPAGPRRINNVSHRTYSGTLVSVTAAGRTVTSTWDHPFWTPSGWCEAGDLRCGDTLKTSGDVLVQVDRIVHLNLRQTDDSPTALGQLGVSPGVTVSDAGMPVDAVCFQGDADVREEEVDGPSADRCLLGEGHSKPFQGFSDAGLKPVLTGESSVAGEPTEGPISVAWQRAEALPAVATFGEHRWTAAGLGAVAPVEVLLRSESCSAPVAVDVVGVPGEASLGAVGLPVVLTFGDGERRAASHTLTGQGRVPVGLIADATTENTSSVAGPSIQDLGVEGFAALGTPPAGYGVLFGEPIASAGTEHEPSGGSGHGPGVTHELLAALAAGVPEGHWFSSLLEHFGGIEVYDIEVDDQHVFYVDTLLVHNCPICQAAEGKNPWDRNAVPAPPLHPYCRCAVQASDPMQGLAAKLTQYLTA